MDTGHAEERDDLSEPRLAVGELIAERYRVLDLLGEGAMGAVYRVEHVHMRKVLALKVLHAEVSHMPEIVSRFEREAVAAGAIDHPNVAAAKDSGRLADGSFFLVLEYVAGESLRELIDRGPVPPARTIAIMRGVLAGIGAAHAKGIVHRDLKPENVMLVGKNTDEVKVLDFGIAKLDAGADDASAPLGHAITRLGTVMGTPDYMAPEQALGQPADARADLYSVGVILFELLTGQCPFRGGPISVLRQQVADEPPPLPPASVGGVDVPLASIVQKLLAKNPADRYASAADLLAALDTGSLPPLSATLALGPSSSAFRTSAAGPSSTPSMPATSVTGVTRRRRSPWMRLIVVAGVASLLGGTLVVTLALTSTPSSSNAAPPPVVTAPQATQPTASATASSPAAVDSESPNGLETESPAATESAAPHGSARRPSKRPGRRKPSGGISIPNIPPPNQWFK